jgi:hypothetical protein
MIKGREGKRGEGRKGGKERRGRKERRGAKEGMGWGEPRKQILVTRPCMKLTTQF